MKNPYGSRSIYKTIGSLIVLLGALAYGTPLLFDAPAPSDKSSVQIHDEQLTTLGAVARALAIPAPYTAQAAGPVPGCFLHASLSRSGQIYSVSLANKGDTTCTGVSYSFYYAAEEKYVSAVPKPTKSNYYWSVGTLKPGKVADKRTVVVAGSGTGTELCASAINGNDTCVTAGAPAMPPEPVVEPAPVVQKKEYGVWIWESPYSMSATDRTSAISKVKAAGFNAIYITIDDYLTIASTEQQAYADSVESFVSAATKAGIAVDVVGGDINWAKPANRARGYTLIKFVDDFNRSHTDRIRGLQYDVEPYLLPEYESNKAPVLLDFVSFIDESATRMASVNAEFSIVIPHFYDSAQKWTPAFSYNGKSGHAFTHLLDALEKKPGSTILIMAYRDYVEGENGSRIISAAEIEEAGNGGYSTDVIVAQETGNVTPAYVTFHGETRQRLADAISALYAAFGAKKGFGGTAVHHLDSYLQLK